MNLSPAHLLIPLVSIACLVQVEAQDLIAEAIAEARDATPQERRRPDVELLTQLLDLVREPLVAESQALTVDLLRDDPFEFRGRVFSVRGRVVDLRVADPANPVATAHTLIIDVGARSPLVFITARSPAGVERGSRVQAAAYFVKLRDQEGPPRLDRAPLLVGDRVSPSYIDWQSQTKLDPKLMALAHPGSWDAKEERFSHTGDMHKGVLDSQAVPLWHLASYVLSREAETSARPLATTGELVSALVSRSQLNAIKLGHMAPGSAQRLIGEFSEARRVEVGANPLGVEVWTEVFLKLGDLGGKIIPIWIPKQIDTDWKTGELVDVGAYYYRGYAYVAADDSVRWTPVFVAAGLQRFVLPEPSFADSLLSWSLLAAAIGLLVFFVVLSRRDRSGRAAHEKAMVRRRRQRQAPES